MAHARHTKIGAAALLLALGGAGALAACGGASGETAPALAPTATQADDEAAADVTEHHRHHHHGGVAMFIAMSLDTLGTTPEQHAAIEKIQADLYQQMEPARAAEQALQETLADGVAAGSIDANKVNAALAQLTAAASGLHDASSAALNQLHATLTPEERKALVDKVEAHWSLWQRANGDEATAAPGEGRLKAMTGELSLTPDQVEKIRTAVGAATRDSAVKPDPQQVEAHLKAFGDAFEGESFDARTLTTGGPANAHLATWGASRMALFLEAATPVLTPDQRAKLAQDLREHAAHKENPTG